MNVESRKEIDPSRIAFFDADKTLWRLESHVPGDDYASRGAKEGNTRTFKLTRANEVTRLEDGTKLILKEGVKETLEKLNTGGVVLGIISDNIPADVEQICILLGISHLFDTSYSRVRLWEGTADKALMICVTLASQNISTSPKILLVDDGAAYPEQMANAGFDFILSPKDTFPKDAILEHFGLK